MGQAGDPTYKLFDELVAGNTREELLGKGSRAVNQRQSFRSGRKAWIHAGSPRSNVVVGVTFLVVH